MAIHKSVQQAKDNWVVLAATGAMTALVSGGISFGTASNVHPESAETTRHTEMMIEMQGDINDLELALAEERHARNSLELIVRMTHPQISVFGTFDMMSMPEIDYNEDEPE